MKTQKISCKAFHIAFLISLSSTMILLMNGCGTTGSQGDNPPFEKSKTDSAQSQPDITGVWKAKKKQTVVTGPCKVTPEENGTAIITDNALVFSDGFSCDPDEACLFGGGWGWGPSLNNEPNITNIPIHTQSKENGIIDSKGGITKTRFEFKNLTDSPLVGNGSVSYSDPSGSQCSSNFEVTLERKGTDAATQAEASSENNANPTNFMFMSNPEHNNINATVSSLVKGNIKWKNSIGGYTTPIVSNNLVFVETSYSGDSLGNQTNGVLLALDKKTGKTVWACQGVADSTPAVLNGTVICVGGGSVFALEEQTGRKKWSFKGPADSIYGSIGDEAPTVSNGVVFAAGKSRSSLFAVDAETGIEKWHSAESNIVELITSSPTVSDGTVVFGNYSTGSDDGIVDALDAKTGKLKWQFKAGSDHDATITISNGTVYFQADRILHAVGLQTGQEIWHSDIGSDQDRRLPQLTGNPVAVRDGVLVSVSKNDELITIDAKTGKSLWDTSRFGENGPVVGPDEYGVPQGTSQDYGWAMPFIGKDLLYGIKHDESGLPKLYALDKKTGEVKFAKIIPGYPTATSGLGPTADAMGTFGANNGPISLSYGDGVFYIATSNSIVALQ